MGDKCAVFIKIEGGGGFYMALTWRRVSIRAPLMSSDIDVVTVY